jgi:hypothetical protein
MKKKMKENKRPISLMTTDVNIINKFLHNKSNNMENEYYVMIKWS